MKIPILAHLVAASGLLCTPAGASIVSHYSFDSGFTDDSGNGRDGTLVDVGTSGNSGITTTAGEFVFGGGAMNFDADRDFIDVPSITFGTGTAYSITFWARKAPGDSGDSAQWDMVIGQRDNTNFFISLNDATGAGSRDGFRWRSNVSASGTREANFGAPDDTAWHHYGITADSSKNMSFYLDGAFQETVADVQTGFIFDTIGEAYTTGRDFDFHGQIDEVWVFDEELDSTEVSNLFALNSTTAVPEASEALVILLGMTGLLAGRRRKR